MIEYYKDMVQGTDEWFKSRLGIVTASNINILLTPTGKPAKGEKVRAYACEIAAQRHTMRVEETFMSYDMERGHIQEDIARGIYSKTFERVEECGFITNEQNGLIIGASPDGLVGETGMIEIKSRLSKFQIKTIIDDEVPAEYMNQIQALMLVSGRHWVDFIQYSNGMPLFVKRVFPDFERMGVIDDAVSAFELIVKEIEETYKSKSVPLVKTEWVDLGMDDEITESEA